ncbi:MAG: cupin domain-containing protein [Angelakisella sp.]
MTYIKNIAHEQVVSLAEQVSVQQGQVVSKTLAQNHYVSITVFAFAKGEEIGSHDSSGDAMVTVLEGEGRFTIDGKEYVCKSGETIVMPAKKPHAVYAQEDFKMILTVVFPQNNQ